ncbi:MAG: MFS transporter [Pseudonocardiales bacterium]|nr:MFS transporter [Pseudonocardiales bacterium]
MSFQPEQIAGVVAVSERQTLRRAIAASAIGNAAEWFDYGVYAYAAVYIGRAFFPSDNPAASTLSGLLVFAVSFLIRPLGGLVWGPLGDRLGRQKILASTIVLMAGATFCVGVLPGYATIGILAPIGLIVLRVIQGFSTGGEYGGAATFMAEYAPDRKRGLCGSFLEFGTLAGFTFGALLVLVTEVITRPAAMAQWGWRLPFLIAAPLGLVGLYLRSKLADTPVFRELQQAGEIEQETKKQFRELARYWRLLLLMMMGLVVTLNVTHYTLLAYMPTYLQGEIGLTSNKALLLVIIGQLIMMTLLPFFGALSDRVGRKVLWWVSIVGMFVLAIPMYQLMARGFAFSVIGFVVLGLLYAPQLSTISAMFPAMFPAHIRYAGFAIAYNLSTSLFGGTAPAANQFLINLTGDKVVPAYYMMAACIVGAIALSVVPETRGCSLRGCGVPGVDTSASP